MLTARITHRLKAAVTSTMLLASVTTYAQSARPTGKPVAGGTAAGKVTRAPATTAQVEALQKQLAEQNALLENMRKALGEQDARYQELQRSVSTIQEAQKAAEAQQAAQREQLSQQRQPSRTSPSQTGQQGSPGGSAVAPEGADRTVRVGTAPPADASIAVAPLFEQPGVLTPKGQGVIEPSLQYGYSSSNRVALVGYTVIPSLLIGLFDVREVKRNTLTSALAVRYGLTNRFEVEARLPYVYRTDSTVSREVFQGTATESAFTTSGKSLGDVEVTGRYQLTDGSATLPYLIGSLRLKTRTGKDPFEVVTDCQTRCIANTTGTGQPLELPTGSGFYMLQPGLTWLYPSDPAVFFGSFTYGYNFKRSGVSRRVLNGESEFIGDVKPGDILGMNVGMGLALNDRSSFSIGIDLNSIGRTKQNGRPVAGSVRTQLATLLLGYSVRYSDTRTINLSVGAGLTRDTPDLTLSLRMPFNF